MRDRRAWTLLVAALAVTACAARDERPTDADSAAGASLSLDATVGGGYRAGGVYEADVHIPAEGDAVVKFGYVNWFASGGDTALKATQSVRLEPADRAALRALVDRSDFFGSWAAGEMVTDQDTWNVTARSGERTKERSIYAQHEFDDTETFLWRVIHQAVAENALAAGRGDVLSDLFRYEKSRDKVLHPEPVVARLRDTALHAPQSSASAGALSALRSLLTPAEFDALLREALAAADDERRQTILAPLVDRGAIALPLRNADAVLPAALAELERSWRDWGRPPEARAKLLRDCASAVVVEHETRAAPLFERMVVELSTDEAPLAMAPLAALGDAAVDPLERLLGHERVGVRIAAAQMCEGLACELTSPSACARPAGADPSRTNAPFRDRLVPKLARAADDATADPRLRRAAEEALAALGERPAPAGWKWHRLDWN